MFSGLHLSFLPLDGDELPFEGNKIITTINLVLEIIPYLVLAYFIYLFYQNYKQINATDSAKTLMKRILKTRKTVMQYVWFNLIYFGCLFLIMTVEVLLTTPDLSNAGASGGFESSTGFWVALIFIVFLAIAVVTGLIWLFYRLIYGILLKRLNSNYKELKKLEV